MHDGSLATLWNAMDHYNKGGVPNPYLDGGMQRLGLTEPEIDDLVAFMFALTSSRYAELGKKEMARHQALKNTRPQRDVAAARGKQGHFGDLAPNPDTKNPAEIGVF
jgi:cytochrome c peroxidase